jgi:hypothetical protein
MVRCSGDGSKRAVKSMLKHLKKSHPDQYTEGTDPAEFVLVLKVREKLPTETVLSARIRWIRN